MHLTPRQHVGCHAGWHGQAVPLQLDSLLSGGIPDARREILSPKPKPCLAITQQEDCTACVFSVRVDPSNQTLD